MQKAVEYGVQDYYLQHLHCLEFWLLILRLEIASYRREIAIMQQSRRGAKQQATKEVIDVSAKRALAFLGK